MKTDKRPDPKPRKHPDLWQMYLFLEEAEEARKRHNLRISSIEKGKSNLNAHLERLYMSDVQYDALIAKYKKMLIAAGIDCGPIWEWLIGIRGLKNGKLAAQLLAQIDDIAKFNTVSKLWRFCGQAVINRQAERDSSGEKSHYNHRLKSICWLISDEFIKQQTSPYVEIYYTEKERRRQIHPEKIKNENDKWMYNDGHLHNMAKRKMVKIFLQHLWVTWRESEGLPITEPYVKAILGHADIIRSEK